MAWILHRCLSWFVAGALAPPSLWAAPASVEGPPPASRCIAFEARESDDKACRRSPGDKRGGWRLVAINPNMKVFLSPDTVRTDRGLKAAWLLWSHEQEQKIHSGPAYQSFKELALFDCKARASASKQQIYYRDESGAGEVVHRKAVGEGELEYLEYAPGSVGAAVIGAACAMHKK